MKMTWITRTAQESSGRIDGTNGNDYFEGDNGGDLEVTVRDDYNGRGGHDFIFGFDGGDRLSGGGGNDTIYGGVGKDKVSGGSGNDTLWGGMHKDVITGGSGADEFIFEAWHAGSGMDIVADFDPREDNERITISTIFGDGIATFPDLKAIMVQDGDNVNMEFDGGWAILVLEHVKIGQLHEDDFHLQFG
jgi:Ca2+-binding RTX toxin-like protein